MRKYLKWGCLILLAPIVLAVVASPFLPDAPQAPVNQLRKADIVPTWTPTAEVLSTETPAPTETPQPAALPTDTATAMPSDTPQPTNTPAPPAPVFSCADGCETQPDPSCNIKGNFNGSGGDAIYHMPGGQFYDSTGVNPEEGDRWFCSIAEAEAAGYRMSQR